VDLSDLEGLFDDEWYCEVRMNITEIRSLYQVISYALEVWPGSPARPAEEQEYLLHMKKQLFAMISDYNFYNS